MEEIAMTTIIINTCQWSPMEEIAMTTIIIITFQWSPMEEIAMTTWAHQRSSTQGPAPQTETCHTHWHTGTRVFSQLAWNVGERVISGQVNVNPVTWPSVVILSVVGFLATVGATSFRLGLMLIYQPLLPLGLAGSLEKHLPPGISCITMEVIISSIQNWWGTGPWQREREWKRGLWFCSQFRITVVLVPLLNSFMCILSLSLGLFILMCHLIFY